MRLVETTNYDGYAVTAKVSLLSLLLFRLVRGHVINGN